MADAESAASESAAAALSAGVGRRVRTRPRDGLVRCTWAVSCGATLTRVAPDDKASAHRSALDVSMQASPAPTSAISARRQALSVGDRLRTLPGEMPAVHHGDKKY
jgi:hypothetical protein